ncbi:mannose-6-phosphate isomerase, partial [Rhizobium sp. UGM030330-04]
MTVQFPSAAQALCEEVGTLRKWLDEDALPLWWEVGSARPD